MAIIEKDEEVVSAMLDAAALNDRKNLSCLDALVGQELEFEVDFVLKRAHITADLVAQAKEYALRDARQAIADNAWPLQWFEVKLS